MNAQQFFGAIVRGLGVYWVGHGITYLPAAAFAQASVMQYVAVPVAELVVGVILMLNADGLVVTCYPKSVKYGDDENR